MKKILLPKSDLRISRVGLGGLHFGSFISPRESINIIHKCLENGINFIETASMYGKNNSSKIIGKALKYKRSNTILSYKIGLEPVIKKNLFKCKIAELNKKYLTEKLDEGLKNLNTDRIDIFQVHAFDKKTNILNLLDAINNFIDNDKIRYFGFSNIEKEQFTNIFKTKHPVLKKLISVQLQFNILERKAEKYFFNICEKKKLSILFNQVFSRGILLNKYYNLVNFPKTSRAFLSNSLRKQINHKILKFSKDLGILSEDMNIKLNDLILSWTLSKFNNSICILGFSKKEQIINYNKIKLHINTDKIEYKIDKLINKNNYKKLIYERPKKFINL